MGWADPLKTKNLGEDNGLVRVELDVAEKVWKANNLEREGAALVVEIPIKTVGIGLALEGDLQELRAFLGERK